MNNKKYISEQYMDENSICYSYCNEFGNIIYHRDDGPAIEWHDGTKFWYLNGKRHRENGPAIEWGDGNKSWYLNDKQYSEEEYIKLIKLKVFF